MLWDSHRVNQTEASFFFAVSGCVLAEWIEEVGDRAIVPVGIFVVVSIDNEDVVFSVPNFVNTCESSSGKVVRIGEAS